MMKSLQSDEFIFRPGDPSECAYLIEAGQVEIFNGDPERPVSIALLGKGDILGEMALIDERPRSLSARAVGPVQLSTVSRDQFVKLMFDDPAEGLRYLKAFFERLRSMTARVAHSDHSPAAPAAVADEVTPIRLLPLTPIAARVLPPEGMLIERCPFRVGREPPQGKSRLSMNDLGLPDTEPFNVSREHFAIDREGDVAVVYDRGSFLGTIVNGTQIGGNRKSGSALLRDGDNEVIAGTRTSPYKFSIVTGEH